MKNAYKTKILWTVLFLNTIASCFSQDTGQDNSDQDVKPRKPKFLTGFYVGSYFANKYSASTYNGYGFDVNGNRNSFENSFMHQKIINEYGGGYGQYDQIAAALGVDQHQWTFSESDMPVNMHYTPAILVGFNFKLPVERRGGFVFNINGTKLNVGGVFTINTIRPPSINPASNTNQYIFPITGKEQRLQFQFGFQQIFGGDDKFNFLGEVGINGTLTKFDQNSININGLQIDLTYYVNQTLYPAPAPTKRPVGFGVGAFGGLGINIDASKKFIVQILYTLTHEKVNIGTNPTLKLQNGIGLRVYYKI